MSRQSLEIFVRKHETMKHCIEIWCKVEVCASVHGNVHTETYSVLVLWLALSVQLGDSDVSWNSPSLLVCSFSLFFSFFLWHEGVACRVHFEVASGRPWSVPKGQRLHQLRLPGPPQPPSFAPLNPFNPRVHTVLFSCQCYRSLPDPPLNRQSKPRSPGNPAVNFWLFQCIHTSPQRCVFFLCLGYKCHTHLNRALRFEC